MKAEMGAMLLQAKERQRLLASQPPARGESWDRVFLTAIQKETNPADILILDF